MANRYAHIRAKAVQLRTEKRMTRNEIVERLQVLNFAQSWKRGWTSCARNGKL